MALNERKGFVVAAAGLAIAVLLPLAAGAAVKPATAGANFCRMLSGRAATERFAGRLGQLEKSLSDKRTQVADHLKSIRDQRDANLGTLRGQADTVRSDVYTRLENQFAGDAAKQAILAFQQAVEAAVNARRTAVTAALDAFRQGLDAVIASRKDAVDAAIKTLNDALAAAESKATSACAAGTDPATVRQQLMADVSAARSQFKDSVQNAAKVGPAVQPLIEARKAAMDKAKADFQAAMDKAKADLKAALAAAQPAGSNVNAPVNAAQ